MLEQLILFEETPEQKSERKILELRISAEKTRKSLFAQISDLKKKLNENEHKIDTLISALCRCKNNDYADLPLFFE